MPTSIRVVTVDCGTSSSSASIGRSVFWLPCMADCYDTAVQFSYCVVGVGVFGHSRCARSSAAVFYYAVEMVGSTDVTTIPNTLCV